MLNIETMKKTELHCHLDGSLSADMMGRHLNRPVTAGEICVDENCHSLTDYLEKFTVPVQCLQTPAHLQEEACQFLKSLEHDSMEYIEVRFAPMLSTASGLTCDNVIESVLLGLEKAKSETGMHYGLITCAMRNLDSDDNMRMLDSAEKYLHKGVCGVDLAGDESRYPNESFRGFFREAGRRGIPFTIHSGETGSTENVRLAIEFGAKRIGHGLAMIKDIGLIREAAARGIGIEMCPTSNFQTNTSLTWKNYPLYTFMEHGIKVSVNTDNRTVSNTTLTKELTLIYQQYHDPKMITQLLQNAKETTFGLERV